MMMNVFVIAVVVIAVVVTSEEKIPLPFIGQTHNLSLTVRNGP